MEERERGVNEVGVEMGTGLSIRRKKLGGRDEARINTHNILLI